MTTIYPQKENPMDIQTLLVTSLMIGFLIGIIVCVTVYLIVKPRL